MKKIFVGIFVFTLFALVLDLNAQALNSIAEIQGDKFRSPKVGKSVKTRGVVTAVRRSGLYIQTPDEKVDNNPKTSEGIYVYTGSKNMPDVIAIGDLVEVKGIVTEYRARQERYGLFLTQITKPEIRIIGKAGKLPETTVLTKEFLKPNGNSDQLEQFEGMLVRIDELTVVAPTGGREDQKADKIVSDGVFFGVLADTPRPFREPGLDVLTALFDKLPRTLPIFDMNPEMLRIDSNGLNDSEPIDVATGAKIKDLQGILDYGYQRYTLLVDPRVKPTVENNMKAIAASPVGEREVTVSSFNLENFFDDKENSVLTGKETKVSEKMFKKRLKKTSLAIRQMISMPDVLGIIEIENFEVLKKLANQLNGDAVADKQENPEYKAFLEESNDVRGIDVGFLVKTSKVNVVKTEQLAGNIKLKHKDAAAKETLFERPPMLMQVEIPDAKAGKNFAFTVIVNHFKSDCGINDVKSGNRVQNKRRMQAEFLAKFIQDRQKENREEKIIAMGDFNAFQFNDGYNDLIGILKGKPERNIISPSQNVYETGLINLVDYISVDSRYSYVFAGSAQTLDHVLINRPMNDHATKFGFVRSNADFPKILANDENRPERVSDHDAAILYLSLDDKNAKKAEVAKTRRPK